MFNKLVNQFIKSVMGDKQLLPTFVYDDVEYNPDLTKELLDNWNDSPVGETGEAITPGHVLPPPKPRSSDLHNLITELSGEYRLSNIDIIY